MRPFLITKNRKIKPPLPQIVMIIIAVTFLSLAVISYLIYQSKITIHFQSDFKEEIILSNQQKHQIAKFKTPQTLRLKPGSYLIQPKGQERYQNSIQSFDFKQNQTIVLNFDFDQSYYDKSFRLEPDKIANLLRQTYPETFKAHDYQIIKGQFFQQGRYYVTAIGQKGNLVDEDRAEKETKILKKDVFISNIYYVVFEFKAKRWQQITHPELILSQVDYPKLPLNLIKQVNTWYQ